MNVTISFIIIRGIHPSIHDGITIYNTPYTLTCTSFNVNVTMSYIRKHGIHLSIHERITIYNTPYPYHAMFSA